MANNRRVSKVSSLIKREISMMLMQDIKDDRVGAGMVSITDVESSAKYEAQSRPCVVVSGTLYSW